MFVCICLCVYVCVCVCLCVYVCVVELAYGLRASKAVLVHVVHLLTAILENTVPVT